MMIHNKSLIDNSYFSSWSTVYHPYVLMLSDKTFLFSNSDKTKKWFKKCFFKIDGTFGNMPSNQEVRWEIKNEKINIFNKKNELYRYIGAESLQENLVKDSVTLIAKFADANRDDFGLFTQDGTHEIVGKNFTVLPNLLTYEGDPSQHIDYNLICPPVYLGQEKPSVLLLQFDVKVDDLFDFMADDTFFVIVGHDKEKFSFSDGDLNVQKLSMNFENLTSKKWKTIAIEIKLSSNYISVGPYLTQKGHAEFKNIKLTELND